MEHNKQNEWHSREFYLERNGNTSYGGNGIPGGGAGGGSNGVSSNILFNTGNNWNDNRYNSKKVLDVIKLLDEEEDEVKSSLTNHS